LFTRLFDTSDFPRRWDCGSWTPGLGWLHILSESVKKPPSHENGIDISRNCCYNVVMDTTP
jgi:hypothetical protein